MEKKKIFIGIGIIAILIIILTSVMIINSNNSKKYLEVAKRILPIMEDDYLGTQEIAIEKLDEIISYGESMSTENATNKVKSTSSYKGYVSAIDKHLSEQYKDLEYLKKHTYTKNKELSKEIKNIVNEYETKMKEFRELDSHYENTEKSFFERIREIQNKLNME